MVYYRVALKNTDPPDVNELKNLGPAKYLESESVFGSYLINEEGKLTFTIKNLRAETDYDLYILCVGRDPLNGYEIKLKTFKTLARYQAAEFNVRFTKDDMNAQSQLVATRAFAFYIGYNPHL